MSIEVSNESGAEVDEAEVAALARYVLDAMHVHPQVEMSVLMVDVPTMSDLHVKWMDEEGPTDVLSFPMDELRPGREGAPSEPGLLGDVVLCPEVAATQAKAAGHATMEELLLLTTTASCTCSATTTPSPRRRRRCSPCSARSCSPSSAVARDRRLRCPPVCSSSSRSSWWCSRACSPPPRPPSCAPAAPTPPGWWPTAGAGRRPSRSCSRRRWSRSTWPSSCGCSARPRRRCASPSSSTRSCSAGGPCCSSPRS